jgi:hypothetical protein
MMTPARVRGMPVQALETTSVVAPTEKTLRLVPLAHSPYERFVPREEKIYFQKLYKWLTNLHAAESALKGK